MKKTYQLVIVMFFVLFLSVPMLKHIIYGGEKNTKENRQLANWPHWPDSRENLSLWSGKFDDYLADHFGYRKVLIRASNKLRFFLFKELPLKNITLGQKEFIYMNSHSKKKPDNLMKFICSVKSPPEKAQTVIMQSLQNIRDKYKQFTYKINILIVPLKAQIYPENLPTRERSWCAKNNPTWFDERLKEKKKEGIIYPLEQFMLWKKEFPVYLSNHFHWHGELPYRMADSLMTSLWDITPDLFPIPRPVKVRSDLSHFLNGLEFKSDSIVYDYKDLNIKVCKGNACNEKLKEIYKRIYEFNYQRQDAENKRSLVIISDSFGPLIGQHFIRGFDEVTVINLNQLLASEQHNFFQQVFDVTNPTHVLFLFNAGGLYSQSNLFKKALNHL